MHCKKNKSRIWWTLILMVFGTVSLTAQRPMEYLDRGLVGLEISNGVFLSWRMLGTDASDVGFNLYRNGVKINSNPITTSTNYVDNSGSATDKYKVETIIAGGENEISKEITPWPRTAPTSPGYTSKPWLARYEIPLPEAPGDDHFPGDMSVGDLDGDGDYEIIFEWEGTIPYIEAIDLEGNSLWRINCGPNTTYNGLAFLVYDFDGDGKAELACKTGPGTIDGTGKFLSKGPASIDDDSEIIIRSDGTSGHLMEDPSYITIFNGMTGAEMATIDYWPPIGPIEEMDATWGDSYGKRSASIKGAVMYDKEAGPMMVFARGIYTRIAMGAYIWDGKQLTQQWLFDSEDYPEGQYFYEGSHSLAVADVDGDGSDELMYGACAIDNTGVGLYSTGYHHGDSHALGDLMPDRPGLEFFMPHEDTIHGLSMRDAATGEILWEVPNKGDIGRAWAADITEDYRGAEIASTLDDYNRDCNGDTIPTAYNPFFYPIYFDGDVQRELRKETGIDDVNNGGRLFTAHYYRASTIHSTKKDANLVADILGDWREEIIFKRDDDKAFVMFSTWIPTERKNYTLMHDPAYRMQIATQNIGYNQVANVSYYFPDGAPTPDIKLIKYDPEAPVVQPDTTKPVILVGEELKQPIDDECTAYVPDLSTLLEVNDEDYIKFYFSQTPEAGTLIGEMGDSQEVLLTVNDGYGNESDVTTVNVVAADMTAPYFTKAFGNHTLSVANSCTKAIPDYSAYVNAEDNCSGNVSFSMSPAAGTLLNGHNDSLIVTVTADDNQGNTADTSFVVKLIAMDCTNSVEATVNSSVEIYPNPATDYIYISGCSSVGSTYTIKSISGKIIALGSIFNNTIDISALSSGMYIIEIKSEDNVFANKVMIL